MNALNAQIAMNQYLMMKQMEYVEENEDMPQMKEMMMKQMERIKSMIDDPELKRQRKYKSATLSSSANKTRCIDIFYGLFLFGWSLFPLVDYIMKWKLGKSNGLIDVIDYFTIC